MFELYAKKNQLKAQRGEPVTSGSVNVYRVRFRFSEDWVGLRKIAVFRAGDETASVLLGEDLECAVPWEVLTTPGRRLEAGVYGTDTAEQVVLPAAWADLGYISSGAAPGEEAQPPTPELWEQALARKGDGLGYTEEGELGLYSGETLLSSLPVSGGGGLPYGVGHGLKVEAGNLTVDAVGDFQGDNTLPMTAAGVQTVVGNIEALLGTI
nr:hypothetical protein [uncultured Oscillibacter sp.]